MKINDKKTGKENREIFDFDQSSSAPELNRCSRLLSSNSLKLNERNFNKGTVTSAASFTTVAIDSSIKEQKQKQ
jgi:hypothetical protein